MQRKLFAVLTLQAGTYQSESFFSVKSLFFFPSLEPINDVIDRPQDCYGHWITTRLPRLGCGQVQVNLLMRKCSEIISCMRSADTIRIGRVAVSLLNPLCNIRVREMVNARAIFKRNDKCVLLFELRTAMHCLGEGDLVPIEESRLILRPVVGALIMHSEDVVSLRKQIDAGTRSEQFPPDKSGCFNAQTLIVIHAHDPWMRTVGDCKSPCLLDNGGPRDNDDSIRNFRRDLCRSICGRFVDNNQLIHE
ncbi:hypothetical protein ASC92_25065 [Variovorax sp. Root411]|nr:hypothetical protein ASC92_25065 [Variovorax sp. Root411]